MNNFVTSQIRTYVPIVVGALIAWLATIGLNLDLETTSGLTIFLTGALQAAYYFIARVLEKKWPQVGTVLLGSSKQPVYKPAPEA